MDLSEDDLSENNPVKEIDGEAAGSKVSFEDCIATFLKLLDLDESILLLPLFVLWLAGRALLRLLMPVERLLSTCVSLFLFWGFLLFLLVLSMGFLFGALHDFAEDDGPRSLFGDASGSRSTVPLPENRV